MDKEQALEKANKYVAKIISEFEPNCIYLFGSYSTDLWTEYSDIDIAVVFDKIETNKLNIAKQLCKIRRDIDSLLEPVVFDKRYDPSGFLEHIMKNGIQLYPNS